MSLPKFVATMQSVLRGFGMAANKVTAFTSYACRRFLPTVADVVKADMQSKQAVGNWQEICSTSESSGTLQMTMAQRYADDKIATSADIKFRLVWSIYITLEQLKCSQISFQDLRSFSVPWLTFIMKPLPVEASSSMPGPADCQHAVVDAADTESEGHEVLEASSSSDQEEQDGLETLLWFRQYPRARYHITQKVVEVDGQSWLTPWCRESPFAMRHEERGQGVEHGMSICKRCIERAPVSISTVLTQLAQ